MLWFSLSLSQNVGERKKLKRIGEKPASLGTALQQHWPLVRMQLISFLSSSAVHGPFFNPTLSQHGCLPIFSNKLSSKGSNKDSTKGRREKYLEQMRQTGEGKWNLFKVLCTDNKGRKTSSHLHIYKWINPQAQPLFYFIFLIWQKNYIFIFLIPFSLGLYTCISMRQRVTHVRCHFQKALLHQTFQKKISFKREIL